MKDTTEYLPPEEEGESIEVQDLRGLNVIFIHAVLDDYGLTSNVFRLYCHLARRAYRGCARASVPSMAEKCRQNKDTIRDGLLVLLEYNIISQRRRFHQTTIYTLNPVSAWKPPLNGWNLKESESKRKRGVLTNPSQNGNEGGLKTETRVEEGNPIKGNPFKEGVPSLFISLPANTEKANGEESRNQKADRVGLDELKKQAVLLTEATPPAQDDGLDGPRIPPTVISLAIVLKWWEKAVRHGAKYTRESLQKVFNTFHAARHPVSGLWRSYNGKLELHDWRAVLEGELQRELDRAQLQNEAYRRPNLAYKFEIRKKNLVEAIRAHPANRHGSFYIEHNVTQDMEDELSGLRKQLREVNAQLLDANTYA